MATVQSPGLALHVYRLLKNFSVFKPGPTKETVSQTDMLDQVISWGDALKNTPEDLWTQRRKS